MADGRRGVGVLQPQSPKVCLLLPEILERAFHHRIILYGRNAVPQLHRHRSRLRATGQLQKLLPVPPLLIHIQAHLRDGIASLDREIASRTRRDHRPPCIPALKLLQRLFGLIEVLFGMLVLFFHHR